MSTPVEAPSHVRCALDEASAWRLAPDLAVVATRGSEVERALDEVFGAMREDLPAAEDPGPRPRTVALALGPAVGGLRALAVDGRPVVRVASLDALAPTLEGMLVGWTVRTREARAALHAASIELGGRAVLFVGAKGSGKSTLALVLAAEGARYLGDELCFVRYDAPLIAEAFPKAVTLKPGSFALAPGAPTHADPIRGAVRYRLPAHRAASARHALPVGMIVFPRWVKEAHTVLVTELDPAEVALRLVMQTFGGLDRDPRMLGLVARLAELPAWSLEYPDGASAALALRRLVARTVSEGALSLGSSDAPSELVEQAG